MCVGCFCCEVSFNVAILGWSGGRMDLGSWNSISSVSCGLLCDVLGCSIARIGLGN